MANTRQSTKRAKQTVKRNERNTIVRNATRTAFKKALEAIKTQDLGKAKEAYAAAIKALDKAASKGAMPKARASRKISRLTHFVKKTLPKALDSVK